MKETSWALGLCSVLIYWFDMILTCSGSPLAPALYVFGDSLFDSGNNNFLPTIARVNYLPYGNKFSQGATGRFTNGRTVVDFIGTFSDRLSNFDIEFLEFTLASPVTTVLLSPYGPEELLFSFAAEFLHLPYPPPYISPSRPDVITGLNFASGSCGILPETGSQFGKCLNLDEQVSLFESTARNDLPGHFNSSKDFSDYLSKSIFTFSIGSNDYISNYLEPDLFDSNRSYPPLIFSQILTGNLSHQLNRLYDLGGRKFVVFEIGPIGCIPSITRKTNHSGLCVEEPNRLVSMFNSNLREMLVNMTFNLRGSAFVLGQANGLGYDAIIQPSKYGLEDSKNPCCTAWGNGTTLCIPFLRSCRDPDKYFFWDGFHETEAFYSIIAIRCFNGTSLCTPLNIEDLVRT